MIKTLSTILKEDRERFRIPRSIQNVIPIQAVYDDGIFLVGRNKYSKTYRFSDINYAVASQSDQDAMFLGYSQIINSFDPGTTVKLTVVTRRLSSLDLQNTILLPEQEDVLDEYREEYNGVLLDKSVGANTMVQEKYVTVSVYRRSVEDARTYFGQLGAVLAGQFSLLGSQCTPVGSVERLRIFHDFYRSADSGGFHLDLGETRRRGLEVKDCICPDSMEFQSDHFKMDGRYGRVLFLRDYPSFLKDDVVTELTSLHCTMMLSIDFIPIPMDEAVREIESRLLGVETNITNWQRSQNANHNFSATVPYRMEHEKQDAQEMMGDITERGQRMTQAVLTVVHTADTKEQLDTDTATLRSICNAKLCQMGILRFQQMDGLNTVLPFGARKINMFRTLITESLAAFMPFRVQDIHHAKGCYYGQNSISNSMIIVDRRELMNGNSFIMGVSGGGKSFIAKNEIILQMLMGYADIIVLDPEREYGPLIRALGGEVIHISATSPNHINALDMTRDYADGANPVTLKSEFILSLCEQLMEGELGPKEKSIIDRCTKLVYREYQQNNYQGVVPTLQDFWEILTQQEEPEAQEIALSIELFTHGSLNTFAQPTNVDTTNRLLCYDIQDLGKQLMSIGMLVVLDSILNRIIENRAKGKITYIFIDEIYLLFQHEYSANFLFTLWKRVRKYGAFATGITQNVEDMLESHTARTMLANSEFLIMLNQSPTDGAELAKLLHISQTQMNHITNVPAGHGLMKVGSALIPFFNTFPAHTKLYQLMTTKPGDTGGGEISA